MQDLVVFSLDEYRFALPVRSVERILRTVEVTRVPKLSSNVLGIINLQGCILPVLNIRRRFGFSDRELKVSDQFLVLNGREHPVVFWIDQVVRVIPYQPSNAVSFENIFQEYVDPNLDVKTAHIRGVIKEQDELIYILDESEFLLGAEDKQVMNNA